MWTRLKVAMSLWPSRIVAVLGAAIYLALYLYILGDLVITSEPIFDQAPGFEAVEGWASRMFRSRVAFTFEPVAALYVAERFAWFLSPVNLFLGAVLAVFLGLNLGFLAFALARPKVCGRTTAKGIFASLPVFLLGFACCAPTILIALGGVAASVTLGFIALRTVLYPLALVGLAVALWVNLRRMKLDEAAGLLPTLDSSNLEA